MTSSLPPVTLNTPASIENICVVRAAFEALTCGHLALQANALEEQLELSRGLFSTLVRTPSPTRMTRKSMAEKMTVNRAKRRTPAGFDPVAVATREHNFAEENARKAWAFYMGPADQVVEIMSGATATAVANTLMDAAVRVQDNGKFAQQDPAAHVQIQRECYAAAIGFARFSPSGHRRDNLISRALDGVNALTPPTQFSQMSLF